MQKQEEEWIEETKEKAAKLSAYVNKTDVEQMLEIYTVEDDPRARADIRKEVDELIELHYSRIFFEKKPLLEAPTREEADGEIRIGHVTQGEQVLHPFGISREELNQHLMDVGRSGVGKTTVIIQIEVGLMTIGVPFLNIDFKQDHRHLIRQYPQMVVLKWSDFRINPLCPPPSVSIQQWKQQFLSILGHVEGIWQGSTQYLLEALDRAYEEKGSQATIGDLFETINAKEESTRKNQDYWSVVRNRLYGLLSQLGETINCSKGMDIERLLQHPVVLEVDGLGREEANFLVLLLFYWIYAYRKAQGHRGTLRHVLIIGEAKRIFTASEQYSQTTAEFSGIPPADIVADEIRDFGEALVTEDQEPTKLSSSLKANSYIKICGSLGNGRDIDDISYAMDLDDEERKVITKLERGEWLVKLSGRYVKPFTIRTEDFLVEKTVTDAELHERMQPMLQQFMQKEEVRELETSTYVDGSIVLPGLSRDAWSVLVNTNQHPFYALTSRQRELNMSGRRIESAKQELIDAGLVSESNVLLTYRRINFLVLTNKALAVLGNVGHDTRFWKHIGNVGHEHMSYQWFIAASLRSLGYETKIEAKLGNRRIDVLAEKDGKKIGIEVEVTTFDLKAKLEGVEQLDELVILAKDERLLESMRRELSQHDTIKEKVRLAQIQQYMREINKIASEADGRSPAERNKPDSNPERKEDGNNPGETKS